LLCDYRHASLLHRLVITADHEQPLFGHFLPNLGFRVVAIIVGIADDLVAAWNTPGVTMRARQQLLRALIVDIVVQYDATTRDITLTIHWRGGQHSQVKVQKPRTGEHGCRTPEEALAVMRTMASRWPDTDIACSPQELDHTPASLSEYSW
jgi:hypothetical protein